MFFIPHLEEGFNAVYLARKKNIQKREHTTFRHEPVVLKAVGAETQTTNPIEYYL